ncbi:putative DNA primase/helicase [Pelomonas aquatica]|uniref:DNA primase/helicase n=1 Tax=Pelomonas aquatica TaxID=431058 RepID=A0ABU1Z9W9_9BURK|nr:VapE domain-containing protein [Pelomonas aquatica]MDR7297416.1 putative DNA primase/helicase [Pelomonas aquatica]
MGTALHAQRSAPGSAISGHNVNVSEIQALAPAEAQIPAALRSSSRPDGAVANSALTVEGFEPLDPSKLPNPPIFGSRLPPTTIANVKFVLRAYGIKLGYDVIKKRLYHAFPGMTIAPDNADNVALTHIVSACVLNNMQSGLIPGYVDAIADSNRINPIKAWIESKPWDGQDRLKDLQNTLTVREDFPVSIRDLLMQKWFRSAAAAAIIDTEFRCRGVLTLQGDQSIGKTAWIMSLLPPSMRSDFLKVDHHLDAASKDSILSAISHWIVEIGELDSSFKKDVARLKGFLTSTGDKVRRPYAKADSEYPRRTVFCATVNHSNFLVDTTGNSRWWTVPVVAINFKHEIDMQQLFAQMAHEVKAGGEWWLTPEEEQLLAEQNKAHLAASVIRERLLDHLDGTLDMPEAQVMTKMMKPIDVLKLLGFEHPTNPQMKECAEVMRELLGESTRSNGANRWPVVVPRDPLSFALKKVVAT